MTGTFRRDGKRVKLPVIGWMRMREAARFEGGGPKAGDGTPVTSVPQLPFGTQGRSCR